MLKHEPKLIIVILGLYFKEQLQKLMLSCVIVDYNIVLLQNSI